MFHIIDDEPTVLQMLEAVFNALGYENETFSSPNRYLEYVASSNFKVPVAVISDIRMPEMDGFQMLEVIRSHYPELRSVMMTGYTDHGGRAGMDACFYLTKPFSMNRLQQVLQVLISCHQHGCEAKNYGCSELSDEGIYSREKWQCPLGNSCRKN